MRRRLFSLRRLSERRADRRANRQVAPLLIEANRAFDNQEYEVAAQSFEQLAEFSSRSAPERIPQFLLQAGRAHILTGQVEQGMARVFEALSMLVDQQRWDELRRKGHRAVQFLENLGLALQAGQVRGWLQARRVTGDEMARPAAFELDTASPKTGSLKISRLPSRCPLCGAPVDRREVEWVDALTAECSYCGGMIHAEE